MEGGSSRATRRTKDNPGHRALVTRFLEANLDRFPDVYLDLHAIAFDSIGLANAYTPGRLYLIPHGALWRVMRKPPLDMLQWLAVAPSGFASTSFLRPSRICAGKMRARARAPPSSARTSLLWTSTTAPLAIISFTSTLARATGGTAATRSFWTLSTAGRACASTRTCAAWRTAAASSSTWWSARRRICDVPPRGEFGRPGRVHPDARG